MKEVILRKLNEIERAENVRILLAVESGSRAWGFASPDSDYDVRFIYVRPKTDYLRLEPIRDVIEYPLDDVLDINGWDLSKVLRLLRKSNRFFGRVPTGNVFVLLFQAWTQPLHQHGLQQLQSLSDRRPG